MPLKISGGSFNRQNLATEFFGTVFGQAVLYAVDEIHTNNRYQNLETRSPVTVCELLNRDNRFITDLLREPRFRGKVIYYSLHS
jgi:hypothetical protein